ncbi:hypothetical protein JNW90_09915, partial [Micromonospora sp. STR1s_5]|nr:hypothetical protein [Micromonospora sp. STR1s_5]
MASPEVTGATSRCTTPNGVPETASTRFGGRRWSSVGGGYFVWSLRGQLGVGRGVSDQPLQTLTQLRGRRHVQLAAHLKHGATPASPDR